MTGKRMGRRTLATLLGVGMLTGNFSGGGIFHQGFVPEVKAAEAPSVSEIDITASANGISAECVYSGYGQDCDCTLELYLNRCDGDGNLSPVTGKEIEKSQSGEGTAATDPVQVDSGMYKASLVMKRNTGGSDGSFAFRDSALYDVERSGNDYIISPHGSGTDGEESRKRDGSSEDEGGEGSSCRHEEWNYETVQEANPDQDELAAGICSVCGETLSYSYVPNSAYASFLKSAADAVRNAREEEVIIRTDRWVSFDGTVFEAMMERPEVSLRIEYRYEGRLYTVTVPAGADLSGLVDENGFCGFRRLDQMFEGEEMIE